jgi:hypothetical protein
MDYDTKMIYNVIYKSQIDVEILFQIFLIQ